MTNWAALRNLDHEALADDLEELAESIRDGDVGIIDLDVRNRARAHEMAEQRLKLEFHQQTEDAPILEVDYNGSQNDD